MERFSIRAVRRLLAATPTFQSKSIRLKLIREGMQDYEYLALLAKLKGQDAADEFAGRIVQNTWRWESRGPRCFCKSAGSWERR